MLTTLAIAIPAYFSQQDAEYILVSPHLNGSFSKKYRRLFHYAQTCFTHALDDEFYVHTAAATGRFNLERLTHIRLS